MPPHFLRCMVAALLFAPVLSGGAGADDRGAADNALRSRADAYRLYMQARDLVFAGRLERAQELLEEVLVLDPGAGQVRARLAELCLNRGDLLCAETEAKRAVDLAPGDADGHKVLSDIALGRYKHSGERRHFDKAVSALRSAAEAEPEDAMLWVRLIRVLGQEGLYDEAEEEARRASALPGADPSRPYMALAHALLADGEHARAMRLLEQLDLPGRSAVPLLRMLADLKAGAEDFAGQVEVLERLRLLRPDDPEFVHRLGHALLGLEDPYAALEPLSKALAMRPSDPTIRRDLARALVKLGQGERALEQFEPLPEVLLTPNTLRLWAQAAAQAGRFGLAAEKLQELMAGLEGTDQESLIPSFRLRAARFRLRAGHAKEALDLVEGLGDDVTVLRVRVAALEMTGRRDMADRIVATARSRAPGDVGLLALEADRTAAAAGDGAALEMLLDAHARSDRPDVLTHGLGHLLSSWGRAPLAARFLDAVGMGDDPGADVLRLRAAVLHAAGRTGEAEAAFRGLLRQRPDDHYALNELGYMLAKEGRSLDEAIHLLERAVSLKPGDSDYLDSLGWALHRSGRSREALGVLRRAVKDASDDAVGVIRGHLGDVYLALGKPQRALAEWRAALTFGIPDPQQIRRKIEDVENGNGKR